MSVRDGEVTPTWIQVPEDLLIKTEGNKIEAIVSATYVDFVKNYSDSTYLQEQAILAPTNEIADAVNTFVLGKPSLTSHLQQFRQIIRFFIINF